MFDLKKIFFLFICLAAITNASSVSAQKPSKEYQVKAVFLFNFTKFIEWPDTSFSTEGSPFVIGILGLNPFGNYLEQTVSGESFKGHPLTVRYYNTTEDIDTCHLLFLNITDQVKMQETARNFNLKSTLTVTNFSTVYEQEEVIRFFIKSNKIQFQINPEAAKNANLVISSKLLNLAVISEP